MLVLTVVVLFAANMSVIIMSLEFGGRLTKKFEKFCSSLVLYGYKLAFHPPLVRWKYCVHVLWLLHKARHGTLQHYSHSQTLLKKDVSALLTRQCYGLIAHSALYLIIKKSLNPIVFFNPYVHSQMNPQTCTRFGTNRSSRLAVFQTFELFTP